MLTALFRKRYLESLRAYRHFYDDIHEYGSPKRAANVFYFIPGINGTPGQIRFVLPSLQRIFGQALYVRCCHLPEFSATRPIWEKYTLANVDAKRDVIVSDLLELLETHGPVTVIVSSNGFYDFLYAYQTLKHRYGEPPLRVLWGACAPDRFDETVWESVFFPVNGFASNGHRWFAVPNHNWLRVVNPETTITHKWRYRDQRKIFFKTDLESRFRCLGLHWDYVSVSCFNEVLAYVLRDVRDPLQLETHALVASKDGYWQGRARDEIQACLRRYAPTIQVTFKPASHLWVVTPENVSEVLGRFTPPKRRYPTHPLPGHAGPSVHVGKRCAKPHGSGAHQHEGHAENATLTKASVLSDE
ncbi:MAG: hypothetical protein GWN84_12505 [Gammaproteobacteria bacterium]|nr:hypothetical protein [Gammaproteobacteria bacterium]NIR83728.1 hypothetical protein [Gammaproteobacteria bacterium]NIR91875.1 hypothetical protein [Gammaproteobacteria bacterium]NIU04894.1 hypothetical protein [Gammaproteobacteria bacterium]NIV51876.1 hypothetical protein [Gammaproteobacteria bacterium]